MQAGMQKLEEFPCQIGKAQMYALSTVPSVCSSLGELAAMSLRLPMSAGDSYGSSAAMTSSPWGGRFLSVLMAT